MNCLKNNEVVLLLTVQNSSESDFQVSIKLVDEEIFCPLI